MGTLIIQAAALVATAISVFSLIIYLWLGVTVLLNGNRASRVTWVGGFGLLLAGLFFLCHGALVGTGIPEGPAPSDYWWRLAWVPAFCAPLLWAATGLYYAGLTGRWRRWRLPALQLAAGLGLIAVLLALRSWPYIEHYGDFVRLLDTSLRVHSSTPPPAAPALLLLGISFVLYVAACAALPWVALALMRRAPGESIPTVTEIESPRQLMWDATDAWGRARPALLAASVCMLLAGGTVAAIGVLTALSARRAALGLMPVGIHFPVTPPGHVPLSLILLDLLVQVSLAGVGVAVGWAVVRQGILIERRLPQRGFVSHWLGMAVAAAVLSLVVAVMATIEPLALPELLVLVALVAGAYALFTWQSYAAHERQLTQLRPFVASLTATRGAWLSTDPNEVEHSIESLFTSLCRDVLGAQHARLALSAGRLQRTFTYEASVDPAEQPPVESVDSREWVVPVSDEHGIFAKLVLGPRADGAGYTSSDLAVARACGDRILDAVGEFAAAQAIVSLARQRGLESELSAALPRRTLHDDVLPRLHLAMLRLDGLRGGLRSAESEPLAADLAAVVAELGRAHHDLAALMRSAPIVASRHLERGIVSALRASLDSEFRGTFDEVTWQVSEHGETAGNALSPVVADLLLGATLEAVRNAGKHARGGALHRTLRLHLRIDTQHDEAQGEELVIEVADDGVGLGSGREASAATPAADSAPGTRTGLLTHSALIALIGGNLSVRSGPDQGTTIILRVPVISHEYDAGDATSATPRPLIAGAS